jgi:hypothetical protein
MIFRFSLAVGLLSSFAVAQQNPPKEVEQELLGRVSAFYQNFVDGSPRKGEAFVAEDTKDYYYDASKMHFESFNIGKVVFSDGFTKAVVMVVGKTERRMAGQTVVMDVPQETHWKIENGKWCWTYHPEDYPLTPMSTHNPPAATGERPKTAGVAPKNGSREATQAAGAAVLSQQEMGLDKGNLTFSPDHPGSTKVVFTNGADGAVQVAVDGPVVRGLKVKLDKTAVPGHGTAVVSFDYDPSDQHVEPGIWQPKGTINFRVYVLPFERFFPVSIEFK